MGLTTTVLGRFALQCEVLVGSVVGAVLYWLWVLGKLSWLFSGGVLSGTVVVGGSVNFADVATLEHLQASLAERLNVEMKLVA